MQLSVLRLPLGRSREELIFPDHPAHQFKGTMRSVAVSQSIKLKVRRCAGCTRLAAVGPVTRR
jgi:hypothetical protein